MGVLAFFQHTDGGVGNAAVGMSAPFQIEYGRSRVGIRKHIGRGLVDRTGARAVFAIHGLTGVQAERIK